jgi:DNA (cytosine-5)-methyltransferase 1
VRTAIHIPVIDLFAGPGGLGEGFSAFNDPSQQRAFRIALSIEKEPRAHETLRLRAFFRQFDRRPVPEDYYRVLRQEMSQQELFDRHPTQAEAAEREAWNAELGRTPTREVRRRIDTALGKRAPWVLLGGPPCQVYSLIGRSRQKGNLEFTSDVRHRLYVEYLQVLADHRPAVFVMENVKGLLSSTLENKHIFERILEDLQTPWAALKREGRNPRSNSARFGRCRYRMFSLVHHRPSGDVERGDYVVRMERYRIPQARHRLIILGLREDLGDLVPEILVPRTDPVRVRDVIENLPRLRSGLSQQTDGMEEWLTYLKSLTQRSWFTSVLAQHNGFASRIHSKADKVSIPNAGRGGEFVSAKRKIGFRPRWFLDRRLNGVCNHSARGHMASDLDRYFFAACFAQEMKRSPELADFPSELLPAHRNAKLALNGSLFADRFRVQLWNRPASTITCHISKDGHYYIHPDASQCRALTVREAARIQTFPDN